MPTYGEIVEILNRDVYSAEARLTAARKNVAAIITEPPSLPQPDGNHRITTAIRERIAASDALHRAVKRNVDFMLDGIVPSDLK